MKLISMQKSLFHDTSTALAIFTWLSHDFSQAAAGDVKKPVIMLKKRTTKDSLTELWVLNRPPGLTLPVALKERLLALVRDLFTFSSKVIKMFILV
jgi:hypothetical protein